MNFKRKRTRHTTCDETLQCLNGTFGAEPTNCFTLLEWFPAVFEPKWLPSGEKLFATDFMQEPHHPLTL